MRALSAALFARLAGDATLIALLGTTAGVASIFAKRPIPAGAGYPLVISTTIVGDTPADLMVSEGRAIQRDIAVYGKAATDFDKVQDAAERIRALFHRRPLIIAGHQVVSVLATGPIDAPAEPDEIGRLLTLSIRLHKPA